MTFRDRRCCTLEGNYYAVSDGACGSRRRSGMRRAPRTNACDGYKLGRRGRCTYKTCVGDGCNVVGGFDLGADDAAWRRSWRARSSPPRRGFSRRREGGVRRLASLCNLVFGPVLFARQVTVIALVIPTRLD